MLSQGEKQEKQQSRHSGGGEAYGSLDQTVIRFDPLKNEPGFGQGLMDIHPASIGATAGSGQLRYRYQPSIH